MVPRSTIHKQKKVFIFSLYITMSFPIPSDIFQNDTKMLKEQQQEMQKRHKRSNVEKSSRDILS